MSQSSQPTSLKKAKKRLKATRVSAQLHAELSEYASLLRAIRMSATSDLTGELIRAGKRQREEEEESIAHRVRKRSRHSTVDGTSDRVQDSEVSEANADPSDTSKKCKSKNSKKHKQSDISTYWPLFPEHCPTPEFDFEEEITTVAEEWLRDSNRSSQIQDAGTDTILNDEEGTSGTNDTAKHTRAVNDEPITFPNLNIRPLLLSTNTFLNTLLSNLARHRTRLCNVEKGKAAPMQWVDVLEIIGSMGDPGLDLETLDQIQNRLCEIYGHEECIALESVQVISKSKQTLQEMDEKFQSTLFDSLSIPSLRTQKRTQTIKKKEVKDKKSGEGDNDDNNDKQEDKADESRSTSSTPIAAEQPNIHTRACSTSDSQADASTSDSKDVTSRPPSGLSSDSSSESDLDGPI